MAATKLPRGYYDPKDHVLVHKDYIEGLIDALVKIHESSGDPAIERICDRALGQQRDKSSSLAVRKGSVTP